MWYSTLLEKNILPDAVIRSGIRRLLATRLRQESAGGVEHQRRRLMELVASLARSPVAIHTREANQQHYEVPSAFFQRVLGPRLKYSSCLWEAALDLGEAEDHMLETTARRADIADGQDVLDLGCGWGSFSLYAAGRFPRARIFGVSNSRTQKEFIEARARALGLSNVRIVTADVNEFEPDQSFDRIVSVEMLEHVRNYRSLFRRIAGWMRPDARFFAHVFCHATLAYTFEVDGDHDWMARHFFTGGLMPSSDLFHFFQDDLRLEHQWSVNGRHYERTLNEWLARMDAARAELFPLFLETYGQDQAATWWSHWRLFFIACAELFGYRGGEEWHVAHYLFTRR